MLIAAEIASFSADPSTGEPVVVLKAIDSSQTISVAIAAVDAAAIAIQSLNVVLEQPLAIDLVKSVIEQLGATLRRVIIDDYKDKSYIARLDIVSHGSQQTISAKASDGIALAMRCSAPIFINDTVLEKVAQEAGTSDADVLRATIAGTSTLHFGHYSMR